MQDLFSRQPPLYAKPRSEPQPSLSDSVLPASARGAPNTVAQPPALPNHGHVIPPAIPPKPQPAHAASVERSPGSPAGFSAAGGTSFPSHSPSTVPPVTGAPSFTPPTFAALDSSYSAPASNPQTPQIQPYTTSHPSRPQDFSVRTQFMPLLHHSRVATAIYVQFFFPFSYYFSRFSGATPVTRHSEWALPRCPCFAWP